MALIPISPAGALGLNTDISAQELPLLAWTKIQNLRTRNAALERMPKEQVIYGTPTIESCFALFVKGQGMENLWLYAGTSKVYCASSSGHTDITRSSGGDYNTTFRARWNGGVLAGVPVLTNGVDVPQMWLNPTSAQKLANLTAWDATERCEVISPFKNYLVALNITKSGVNYPTLVKWSHPADPGTPPPSWDETDPTKDAGEYPLSETPGAVVDQLSMRDINVIYKKDSVWGMQYIGGEFIFRFFKIFDQFGIPSRGFMCQVDKARHLVCSGTDLLVHDGQQYTSIATDRVRKYLRNIPEDSYAYCFMVSYQLQSEAWFCWRYDQSLESCDRALVWNWKDNSFTERILSPSYHHIAAGPVGSEALGIGTWDSDSGTWADDTTVWNDASAFPETAKLFGSGTSLLYLVDSGIGDSTECIAERQYLGTPLKTGQPPDISSYKFCRRVWPRLTADTALDVEITLGSSDEIGGVITWKTPVTFSVGVDKKMDCTLSGRCFAIRIRSQAAGIWRLHGIDWDVDLLGEM
ncbi:MAG TPA: hypothetical protein PLB04_04895 [Nitrospira sp.]|nr:hypothetical protein [Nitrospira sp.]